MVFGFVFFLFSEFLGLLLDFQLESITEAGANSVHASSVLGTEGIPTKLNGNGSWQIWL